jgi:hypothetical protein
MIILLVLMRCVEAVLSTAESRLYDPALNDIQLMLDHLAMLKENRHSPSKYTVTASNLENFHFLPLNEKLMALEQPPIISKDQHEFLSEDELTEFLSIHSTLEAAIQILEPTSIRSQFRGGGQQRHPLLS